MISDRLPEDFGELSRAVEPFLDRIARAQEAAALGFRPRLPAALRLAQDGGTEPVKGAAAHVGPGRTPLLAPGEIEVDQDAFARLLREIVAALLDWTGERAADGGEAGPALEFDDAGLRALLEACIKGGEALEQRAEAFGLDAEVFAPAVRYAFAPFLRAYASELSELSDGIAGEADLPGRCPVCGSEPAMAEFDAEDGHRRLGCGLCGTAWRFARLKCPFCGTDDQKDLGFLALEGLDGLRADVCEACGRYLKTVDRRKVGKTVCLEAADVATPELDEAALSFLEERRQ